MDYKHEHYLQYFNHTLFIGDNINGFKHFTVLAPAKLPDQLIVILLPVKCKIVNKIPPQLAR